MHLTHLAEHIELSPDIDRAIFRIVQECLTNVLGHSGSRTATVNLSRAESQISVAVTDQGRGISPEERSKIIAGGSLGVGLRGMRERVAQLGGNARDRVQFVWNDDHGTLPAAWHNSGLRGVVRLWKSRPHSAWSWPEPAVFTALCSAFWQFCKRRDPP